MKTVSYLNNLLSRPDNIKEMVVEFFPRWSGKELVERNAE